MVISGGMFYIFSVSLAIGSYSSLPTLYVVLCIICGICNGLNYFSPISWTCHLLSSCILQVLGLLMKQYADFVYTAATKKTKLSQRRLKESTVQVTPEPVTEPSHQDLLDSGFALLKALKTANEALGMILLVEVSICLLSNVCSLYFMYVVYSLFSGDVKNYYALFNWLTTCIVFVMFTVRLLNLTYSGQTVKNQMREAKTSLQKYQWSKFDELSPKTHLQIGILQEELSQNDIISPKGLFTLDKVNMFSALGIFMTYVLVLLQFKVSEPAIAPSGTTGQQGSNFTNCSDTS